MRGKALSGEKEGLSSLDDDSDIFWQAKDVSRLLHKVMWSLVVIGLIASAIVFPRSGFSFVNSLGLCFSVLAAIGLILLRQGRRREVVALLLWVGWAGVSVWGYLVLGLRTPGLYAYPVLIMLAGWMLGRRSALGMSALSLLNLGGLFWAESAGWLSLATPRTHLDYFVVIASVVSLAGLFAVFVSEGFRRQYRRQVALANVLRGRLEALRRAEAESAYLFNMNPLPCLVTRVEDGMILEVNHAWERELGWSRDEVVGRSTLDLGFWQSSEERTAAVNHLRKLQHLPPRPKALASKNGEMREYLISGEVIEVDGELRMLNTMLDQTQRLQAEEEVRHLNATLEVKVEARTSELTQAIERLRETQEELLHSEKLASLGALVAGISHDLNTPIGNTLTVATTLQDRVRNFNATMAKGDLKKSVLLEFLQTTEEMSDLLERSSRRAAELVASFKQVAADQVSERRRTFDLKEVIDDVLMTLRPALKNTPWQVSSDIPLGIACDSYPGPLGQVLSNLVQNACLHAFEGRSQGVVSIVASTPVEGWVRLTVSDDGIGMDAATLARVFDPFFTTRLGRGGSGLGMSISYRIVTSLLGGAISAESTPGEGTRFTVMFPMQVGEPL